MRWDKYMVAAIAEKVIYTSAVVMVWYLFAYLVIGDIDRAHCEANNTEYGHTTYLFEGYCELSTGMKVPARLIGND